MANIEIKLSVDGDGVTARKSQSNKSTLGELCMAATQLEIMRLEILGDISNKSKSMGVRLEK